MTIFCPKLFYLFFFFFFMLYLNNFTIKCTEKYTYTWKMLIVNLYFIHHEHFLFSIIFIRSLPLLLLSCVRTFHLHIMCLFYLVLDFYGRYNFIYLSYLICGYNQNWNINNDNVIIYEFNEMMTGKKKNYY